MVSLKSNNRVKQDTRLKSKKTYKDSKNQYLSYFFNRANHEIDCEKFVQIHKLAQNKKHKK